VYLPRWLSTPRQTRWLRFTVRQDYSQSRWDLYVDGRIAMGDLGFSAGGNPAFQVIAHGSAPTRWDNLLVSFENPLFPDLDKDGMDDAWEIIHGLDATVDDRQGDPDQDTLSNIEEYALGSRPDRKDTDGDGLSDAWEVDHGYGLLSPESESVLQADSDEDGLTLLQEAQAGTDPNNPDTDGDGLNDAQELSYGLDPTTYDADDDKDGDGVPNHQEIEQGTDLDDYYNGVLPELESLVGADGQLGPDGLLAIRVTDADGRPLNNAPVTLTLTQGETRLASSPEDGELHTSIVVRTGEDGIARVYVKRTEP
jgi:hypothetical protein